jgi:hypothetical protein
MVSLLSLVLATLLLVIALQLSRRFGVLADGLLLGGVFTLLCGVGAGIGGGGRIAKFVVAGVGLLLTLVLGYVKFCR